MGKIEGAKIVIKSKSGISKAKGKGTPQGTRVIKIDGGSLDKK